MSKLDPQWIRSMVENSNFLSEMEKREVQETERLKSFSAKVAAAITDKDFLKRTEAERAGDLHKLRVSIAEARERRDELAKLIGPHIHLIAEALTFRETIRQFVK